MKRSYFEFLTLKSLQNKVYRFSSEIWSLHYPQTAHKQTILHDFHVIPM